VILGILVAGIVYIFRQVMLLDPEVTDREVPQTPGQSAT